MPAGLPYALFYGAVFLALGVYLPFWPVWMKDRGLGPSEIGLILALASWVRIFSTPMIGQAADRSQRAKTVLCLLALGSLVSFVSLHWLNGFWALLWFNLLAALLLQPHAKKGRSIKPSDLAKFPWEETAPKKKKTQSEKTAEGLLMAWAKPANDGTQEPTG